MNAALQLMLMQPGDDPGSFTNGTMVLFPSWNCQWDVDFKIHGPLATVVEGVLVNGKLVSLNALTAVADGGDPGKVEWMKCNVHEM